MEGVSLKSRAIVFAMCAGAVAFILALRRDVDMARSTSTISARALIPAIVCAVMCWASAERADRRDRGGDRRRDRAARARRAMAISTARSRRKSAENVPQLAHCDGRPVPASSAPISKASSGWRCSIRSPRCPTAPISAAPASGARPICRPARARRCSSSISIASRRSTTRWATPSATCCSAWSPTACARWPIASTVQTGAPTPLIGRLAGDEFTMFFPGVTRCRRCRRGSAAACCSRLPSRSIWPAAKSRSARRSASRCARSTARRCTDLMRAADAAMYHAKASGRGRAEHFTDALAAEIADRAQLESDLREAIDAGPVRAGLPAADQRCGTARIVGGRGAAALAASARRAAAARQLHPARRGNRADRRDRRMGDRAPSPRRSRAGAGSGSSSALRSTSASASSIMPASSAACATRCTRRTRRRGCSSSRSPRRWRCIAASEVIEAIAALRADGATIAIDDFGTGYSNLAAAARSAGRPGQARPQPDRAYRRQCRGAARSRMR